MYSRTAVTLGAFLIFLASCASHQVVPNTGPHPAIDPQQVQVLQKAPSKYEILGPVSVEITPDMRWDQSGNTNLAFSMLRRQAAGLGANGLLLDPTTPGATYELIAGYDGNFFKVPMHKDPLTAVCMAIYVVQE
jgi:hypothetical protein